MTQLLTTSNQEMLVHLKILFVKWPSHPSVLYRSAACPFFLMGQRQRCKNFQLFTLRREAEYIKDQLCINIFHRGQGAKIIWWSITHQPDLASLLPSKSTMCGTFPKKISWTKRVHFRPKLKNSVKSEMRLSFFAEDFCNPLPPPWHGSRRQKRGRQPSN